MLPTPSDVQTLAFNEILYNSGAGKVVQTWAEAPKCL